MKRSIEFEEGLYKTVRQYQKEKHYSSWSNALMDLVTEGINAVKGRGYLKGEK